MAEAVKTLFSGTKPAAEHKGKACLGVKTLRVKPCPVFAGSTPVATKSDSSKLPTRPPIRRLSWVPPPSCRPLPRASLHPAGTPGPPFPCPLDIHPHPHTHIHAADKLASKKQYERELHDALKQAQVRAVGAGREGLSWPVPRLPWPLRCEAPAVPVAC
jgi:hypothetical protein